MSEGFSKDKTQPGEKDEPSSSRRISQGSTSPQKEQLASPTQIGSEISPTESSSGTSPKKKSLGYKIQPDAKEDSSSLRKSQGGIFPQKGQLVSPTKSSFWISPKKSLGYKTQPDTKDETSLSRQKSQGSKSPRMEQLPSPTKSISETSPKKKKGCFRLPSFKRKSSQTSPQLSPEVPVSGDDRLDVRPAQLEISPDFYSQTCPSFIPESGNDVVLESDELKLKPSAGIEANEEDKIIPSFLSSRTCYSCMAISDVAIVLSTELLVKYAFSRLLINEVRAALLWESETQKFVGMFTITDFINVLRHSYYSSPQDDEKDIEAIEEETISAWRNFNVIKPIVKIGPEDSLLNAAKLFLKERIHRIPVFEEIHGRQRVLNVLTRRKLLRYLQENLLKTAGWYKKMPFLMKTIGDLQSQIGTWNNLTTVSVNTKVIDALDLFCEKNVSALPVIDENDEVYDIFSKLDVFALAKEDTYDYLEMTVAEALEKAEFHEELRMCSLEDSLECAIEKLLYVKGLVKEKTSDNPDMAVAGSSKESEALSKETYNLDVTIAEVLQKAEALLEEKTSDNPDMAAAGSSKESEASAEEKNYNPDVAAAGSSRESEVSAKEIYDPDMTVAEACRKQGVRKGIYGNSFPNALHHLEEKLLDAKILADETCKKLDMAIKTFAFSEPQEDMKYCKLENSFRNVKKIFASAKTVAKETYDNLNETVAEAIATAERYEDIFELSMVNDQRYARRKFFTAKVHRLVVIDDKNKLIGMISLSDVLKFLMMQTAEESGHIDKSMKATVGGTDFSVSEESGQISESLKGTIGGIEDSSVSEESRQVASMKDTVGGIEDSSVSEESRQIASMKDTIGGIEDSSVSEESRQIVSMKDNVGGTEDFSVSEESGQIDESLKGTIGGIEDSSVSEESGQIDESLKGTIGGIEDSSISEESGQIGSMKDTVGGIEDSSVSEESRQIESLKDAVRDKD